VFSEFFTSSMMSCVRAWRSRTAAVTLHATRLIHQSAWKVNSANFAMKLSEKGFEQRSERGFGRCSGVETGRTVPLRCLLGPRFGHLRDFSDSLRVKFAGSALWEVGCIRASRKASSPSSQSSRGVPPLASLPLVFSVLPFLPLGTITNQYDPTRMASERREARGRPHPTPDDHQKRRNPSLQNSL